MFYKNKICNYLYLIRFDKPIGTILLLWPTLWALTLASYSKFGYVYIDFWVMFVFLCGVFLMRSAGCIINDITDFDIDGHVERTKNRPLVTKVTSNKVSIKEAIYLLLLLFIIAFILVLSLGNIQLVYHSLIALFLASIYPSCKRFFACPQFVLGLAFAYSIPMAYIAVLGFTTKITWLLYSLSVIQTIIYDSFYALADIDDDKKLNLKSSVILFGKMDLIIISILQIIFLLNLFLINYLLEFNSYYITIFLVSLMFIYQISLAQHREPGDCLKAFRNNSYIGLLVFLGFNLSIFIGR